MDSTDSEFSSEEEGVLDRFQFQPANQLGHLAVVVVIHQDPAPHQTIVVQLEIALVAEELQHEVEEVVGNVQKFGDLWLEASVAVVGVQDVLRMMKLRLTK